MSVDLLFAQVDRLLGDKSGNFKRPLAEALARFTKAAADLSQASPDVRAREMFDKSDHPQVSAAREALAAAERKIEEAREQRKSVIEQIKAQLPATLSDEQKTALRAERNAAKKDVVANVDGLRSLATRLFEDAELAAAVEEFATEFGKGRSGGGGSRGSSGPKARVKSISAVHPSGQNVEASTFGKVAYRTKIDAGLLTKGWHAAAGTNDWREITDVINYPVGEWQITVTPRDKEAVTEENTADATESDQLEIPI